MRPSHFFIAALSGIVLSHAPLASARCEYEKRIHQVFPTSALHQLTVNALAGSLDVRGGDGDEVVFSGKACADKQRYLDRMSLDVEERGDQLELTVIIPYDDPDFHAEYAYMDIELTVPRHLETRLRDSSGDLVVEDASVIDIDDSSGDIRVTGGRTDLSVEDSSGDITLRNMAGSITVEDSSGEIRISEVKGNVTIPRDSSGDIGVSNVSGTVQVRRDSSGSIRIDRVGQGVTIDSDGSGDIDLDDIEGDVSIGSDGSGRVDVRRIGGNFTLAAKGDGSIRVRDVKGSVSTPR